MVITNEHDPLEPTVTVDWFLQHQRNEGLHFENLRRLFHQHVVVRKTQGCQLAVRQSSMRARHGDDASLLGQQVLGAVTALQASAQGDSYVSAASNDEATNQIPCGAVQMVDTLRAW